MRLTAAQKFRRRRLVVFGGLATALTVFSYLPMTLLAPIQQTAPVLVEYQAPAVDAPELAWPASAATAVGAVGFPGVLASTGSTEQRAIASITKIITSLVVLEEHPLGAGENGPTITFGPADVQYYNDYLAVGGSVKQVRTGLSLSQRELFQLVLVASANNYAKSLVVWAFGSESKFLDAARAWLAEKSLKNTEIYEPTGMDPNNVSTASDLLEIAKLAVADPTVSKIVGKATATLPYIGTFENSNKLLGQLGIDGIKTGTLDAAGACLLFSADFQVGSRSVTVVGVALGGVDHKTQFPQVRSLMETVAAGFQDVPLVTEGDVFGHYATVWDDEAEAVASESLSELIWGDATVTASVTLKKVGLIADGSAVGQVTFRIADRTVSVPLELEGELADPGPAWRLGNPFLLAGG